MKVCLLITFCFCTNIFSQNIYNQIPGRIDITKKYIFYLHGKIIEDQGIHAANKEFGSYEYESILKSLADTCNNVISEPRPKNTDPFKYAKKVVQQIDSLLKSGVPVDNITIIGASKGGGIAVLISHLMKNCDMKFVIISVCSEGMARAWKEEGIKLWGKVLYIYDYKDEYAGSCKDYLDILRSEGLKEYKEIELKIGLRHGLLYKPLKEWITPALEWVKN